MSLTAEELEQARTLADPVRWAYVYLNWEARWYQEQILRDDALRLVLRCGRRIGKTTTVCVWLLWYCFTHRNKRVLIATPYESQIRAIWEEFDNLIANAPDVQVAIKSKTKNPYIIRFGNGSRINGFTVGTKAGTGGANVRGQGADVIFLDEQDYMEEQDVVAITSLALEDPARIRIILSSTPSGRRGFFYRVCTDPKTTYKQYHFTSHVNPKWTQQAEEEFKLFHSEIDYQHEILAEFGEEAYGVFKKVLVEKAASVLYYAYDELNFQQQQYVTENNIEVIRLGPYTTEYKAPPGIRIAGIDWDKFSATPQIVILEYNQELQKFQVVYHESIPKSEFSLDHAVNRIIELNEIYNPAFIYCDRGMGEYQVETLRIYGLKHPQSGLDYKVKGIAFNQNIQITDPATKELVNKPAKHFMVNQTALMLEREQLILSPFDEMLYRQMLNYSVVRISSSGQPVYTSKDEHALDALMLCVLGFVLEYPELTKVLQKPSYASRIRALPNVEARKLYEKFERVEQKQKRRSSVVAAATWGPRGRGGVVPRRRIKF